jgi:hypothetical protein
MKLTKIFTFITGLVVTGIVFTGSVLAINPKITVTQLDAYINYQNFKVSYSAINNDPGSISVQFAVSKDGGAYTDFGPVINGASGQVQVESGQISETGKKYCLRATIIGGSATSETCTTYIQRTPAAPSNYWKERVNDGLYRIHWKTPNEDDFSRVFVYRSKNITFTAEDSTKIAEVGGVKDTDIAWDNLGVDPGVEYYYLLRAVDKAGNASDLVGDTSTTTNQTTVTQQISPAGAVTSLPQEGSVVEDSQGQVLAAEAEAPQTLGEQAKNVVEKVAQFAKDKTELTIGLLIIAALVLRIIINTFRKRKT